MQVRLGLCSYDKTLPVFATEGDSLWHGFTHTRRNHSPGGLTHTNAQGKMLAWKPLHNRGAQVQDFVLNCKA